ncbi:MAG TPA: flagellar motor switch protein FliG [Solirubrobacteraceae bacterium]|nr:flagellar motor switch protein FliG [Solirubrobacteraceae bacterium]
MASEPGSEMVGPSPEYTAERLRGARKAAVLMAALGSERAASVMQQMQEDEIENISLEMAKLSSVGAQATESVFSEFVSVTGSGESGARGGLDFAREVIERALGPERAAELLAKLSSVVETHPFEFLRRTPPGQIAGILRSESPQTAALVLANLHANLAAQVLVSLPERVQPDIAQRIARMGDASPAVIQQVEEFIRKKLSAVVQQEYSTAGGAKALAAILNHADRSTERNVLDNLATTDQELADEVRGMLFVFEDIVKLEERAIQQILREVDQKDLVLALRGASETVTEAVLSNMSERGAAMLKEEMEIQQPQRKRDVEDAQTRIVAVVRKLEEAGTIVIAGAEDEESEAVV